VSSSEVSFAATIRSIVADHPTLVSWSPGSIESDVLPSLQRHLEDVGWYDLGRADALSFVGVAAVELGRGLVSVRELDMLLGATPYVAGLTRYARAGDHAFVPRECGLDLASIEVADPVPYGDSIGACKATVVDRHLLPDSDASSRETAWIAATVGYLAGLTSEAVRMAVSHAQGREAFGATLFELEGVQHRLADAAMCADGLLLLAQEAPSMDDLAYAGPASCAAMAECHQVIGALGYTLEYPLQRFSRRARTIQLWADAWIEARC
jgi:acyl-CoA dehydrogenase-like protein